MRPLSIVQEHDRDTPPVHGTLEAHLLLLSLRCSLTILIVAAKTPPAYSSVDVGFSHCMSYALDVRFPLESSPVDVMCPSTAEHPPLKNPGRRVSGLLEWTSLKLRPRYDGSSQECFRSQPNPSLGKFRSRCNRPLITSSENTM